MTSNSFTRHGISHLSASSLNLWRSAPGVFALRYLAGIKDAGNASMWRGSAVENGMAVLLRGTGLTLACDAACQAFDLNCQGETSEEIEAERDLIAPMLVQCVQWKPPGPLNAAQLRVEYFLDDVPIPVIGYLDLAFDGIDIDLKTTKAAPSTPRAEHVRQVSLYRAARGRAGGILYVTAKRHQYFDVDDDMMERALGDLQADATSLQHFLSHCNSKEDALRSLPIDYDDFRAPKIKVPLSQILLAG